MSDHRGQIQVDEQYRTAVPHIYAVGDVIGPPGLASASYDQGRSAAKHWVSGSCRARSELQVPSGIYTTPEISSIGRTERELTEQKIPYEVESRPVSQFGARANHGSNRGRTQVAVSPGHDGSVGHSLLR